MLDTRQDALRPVVNGEPPLDILLSADGQNSGSRISPTYIALVKLSIRLRSKLKLSAYAIVRFFKRWCQQNFTLNPTLRQVAQGGGGRVDKVVSVGSD